MRSSQVKDHKEATKATKPRLQTTCSPAFKQIYNFDTFRMQGLNLKMMVWRAKEPVSWTKCVFTGTKVL